MNFSSFDMIIAFSLGLFLGASCVFICFAAYIIKKSKYEESVSQTVEDIGAVFSKSLLIGLMKSIEDN